MNEVLRHLKEQHENSEDVWFLVSDKYRILLFNKAAFRNSKPFHGKELSAGDSILDYARDTNNRIDDRLITCLGKACGGETVQHEQIIEFESLTINTISTFTPIYENSHLLGISIIVQVSPDVFS